MTDQAIPSRLSAHSVAGVARRHARERRLRLFGLGAIILSLGFLLFFLLAIGLRGYGAFIQTQIALDVHFDAGLLGIESVEDSHQGNFRALALDAQRQAIPQATSRQQRRALSGLFGAALEFELQDKLKSDPSLLGQTQSIWVTASDDVDLLVKGAVEEDSAAQRLNEEQREWLSALAAQDRVRITFNFDFLTQGDSRHPELAGVWGAIKGSFFALGVCLAISFIIGVLAATYLQEFAPSNRWTHFLEVNINNLAAVPSITFGLLGLAVFLGFFGLPRSAALVGGLVLSLMTLPTIIITSRVALQAVPPSIREAALALGASPVQAVFHHVFPLALPGMLTGTILGMARALGETAPLLMIGMVAFIAEPPDSLLAPASALPVQVYLWADSPERGFVEKTAGAIIVLLVFLVIMNLLAVLMRKRFEKRF